MTKKPCALATITLLATGALALAGCGSSSSSSGSAAPSAGPPAASSTSTTASSGNTLVEAADQAASASGYRINATMNIKVGSQAVALQMAGTVSDHGRRTALTTHESVAGQSINLQVRVDGKTFYMTGIPDMSKLTGGKRWLSYNFADAEAAEGLGGLQSQASSNPAQFLTYLKAVGSNVTEVGSATIDGTATTEYRASIDFDKYTSVVPAAQRAAARKSIAELEKELGLKALPVTVWVDSQSRARRMQFTLPTCVEGQRLSMSMTMNLSDYGSVAPVAIPPASQTKDITAELKAELAAGRQQLQKSSGGCPAT